MHWLTSNYERNAAMLATRTLMWPLSRLRFLRFWLIQVCAFVLVDIVAVALIFDASYYCHSIDWHPFT